MEIFINRLTAGGEAVVDLTASIARPPAETA
jgi:hypothetical protein